jgi:hypothetical protein
MYYTTSTLFEKAKLAVEESDARIVSRDVQMENTGMGQRESVEDFIRRIESISGGFDEPIF